ncbi:MAG: molybdenum ABC transporter ATP-binding protein [Gammaproteobacteria bacterium]|nr:molybdenum ABC transporter ATP-binding protein [Gammaproteobacteria bacterium]MBK81021.1 molybdenum ABC transporter ATP-binding protein [Gammaproteobacteria bacterium]|tara:strand:+ start:4498 stop:5592 length:1095 start_codon:yes stop_codon:yes gene_type:complete
MSAERLDIRVEVSLDGFRLDVDESLALDGVTAVFGPSGGGKSTLLRTVAGLTRPDAGRIRFGDALWFDADRRVDVPAHRRPVGFLFQDARLFPHLDVAGNLDFAARRAAPGARVDRHGVVDALDLSALLSRRVSTLSGGERQRVALGRTLLRGPRLLLLDEPLTGLDRVRKAEILPYLEQLPAQFDVPTLYVSHDVDEVAALAHRMLVLADGRVQCHDRADVVVAQLGLEPSAGGYGAGSLLEGAVVDHDARLRLTRVDVGGDLLTLPHLARFPVGAAVRLRVRARDVALGLERPRGISIRNVLPGTLEEIVGHPDTGAADVWIRLRGARLQARLTVAAVEDLGLEPGMDVFALIKSVSFDRAD